MAAVRFRWPNVLVQFGAARRAARRTPPTSPLTATAAEDFSSDKAATILQKYRMDFLCFNDDIQGTGATTLAGVLSALRAAGGGGGSLGEQRIVVVGAGSAGLGVATTLLQGMVHKGMRTEVRGGCGRAGG